MDWMLLGLCLHTSRIDLGWVDPSAWVAYRLLTRPSKITGFRGAASPQKTGFTRNLS